MRLPQLTAVELRRGYYIVVHAAGTTTCRVFSFLAAALALVQIACSSSVAAGERQSFNRRYEAVLRIMRDAARAPVPLVPTEDAWTVRLTAAPSAPAALDNERIYVPVNQAVVVALVRETGRMAWSREIAVSGALAVGAGRVYVPAQGMLTALDAATGNAIWSVKLEAPLAVRPVWTNGWVIGIAEPGVVLAFRAEDGALIWRRELEATTVHPPASEPNGNLFVSLSNGSVVALDGADGDMVWERELAGTLSEPTATFDTVFVGSTDNFFYAIDIRNGAIRWKWRNGGDVVGSAVDGDVVYFASLDNMMRAVNVTNGNQRWRRPTGTRPILPPVAYRGIIALPGVMPTLTVFVGETGEVMGTIQASGDLAGPPLLDPLPRPSRVALWTVTREGVIDALRPSSLMFREGRTEPVQGLPGRPLAREPVTLSSGSGARDVRGCFLCLRRDAGRSRGEASDTLHDLIV